MLGCNESRVEVEGGLGLLDEPGIKDSKNAFATQMTCSLLLRHEQHWRFSWADSFSVSWEALGGKAKHLD